MEPFFPGRPGLGSHKGCAGHGSVYDLAPALMEEVKNVDSKVKSSSNACRAGLGGGRSALQGEEDTEKQMERLVWTQMDELKRRRTRCSWWTWAGRRA